MRGDMSKLDVGELEAIVISRTGRLVTKKSIKKKGSLLAIAQRLSASPTLLPAAPQAVADGGLACACSGHKRARDGGAQADERQCKDCSW